MTSWLEVHIGSMKKYRARRIFAVINGEILVEPIAVLVIIANIKSNTSMKIIDFPNFAMFRHIPLYFGDFLLSFGMVRKTTEGHRETQSLHLIYSL